MKIKWTYTPGYVDIDTYGGGFIRTGPDEVLTGTVIAFVQTPEGTKAIVIEDGTTYLQEIGLYEIEVVSTE